MCKEDERYIRVVEKFDTVIQDQLKKGIIKNVNEYDSDGIQNYIPHHAVITPQKTTTKIRVVYDASAKISKDYQSLNECLYREVMLCDLCGLLIRFRLKNIESQSVESKNIQLFRFCRVPFGVISSQFLLGATIEAHLDTFGSAVAEKLKGDIYVDNIITGAPIIDPAIVHYQESKDIFNQAAMNLREWLSNSDKKR
jgi:hypothetical protein